MDSSAPPPNHHNHHNHHHNHQYNDELTNILHTTTASFLSLIPTKTQQSAPPHTGRVPFKFAELSSRFDSKPSSIKKISSDSNAFPPTVRIAGLNSTGKGRGPAFVGQVFSMCDLSGTGLMAVSTHFDVPFIKTWTPEWLKKMFASVTKSERNGPVFRFFMDLGDAVTYVKRLNIPSGVVGACRLDLAYEHFKEKPELFQFVPNEKQVKAANQLLKEFPQRDGRKTVDGVPVFTAQNLDIAIATSDGIKWYTPYFFDKSMLDNILEESADQHFHALIQTRNMQRHRDVVDDSLSSDLIEEMGDSLMEPPEVQEVLDEVGQPVIPLSVISKAAEIQLLYAVDRILLGNRWLRKATGIQPRFPYVVDSFERRSAFSFQRDFETTNYITDSEGTENALEPKLDGSFQTNHGHGTDLRLPLGDWLGQRWLKQWCKPEKKPERIGGTSSEYIEEKLEPNPLLPKITMVGISTGEAGQMSKASLKKTMEDLTKELEQTDEGSASGSSSSSSCRLKIEARDPLFVANVGDYHSGMSKTGSTRWVRGGNK